MANEVTMNSNTVTDLAHWIPEMWARKCYEEAKAKHFWQRFSGPEGSGMPFIIKTELLTQPGDTIHISQVSNLSGAGVSGNTRLRGTEEKLSLAEITVVPEWNRHAVSDTAKASKQINQDFRVKAQKGLSYWMANKMDSSVWTAAEVIAAAGFEAAAVSRVYAGAATSDVTITSTMVFSVTEIRKAAAKLASANIPKIAVPGMPAGDGYYLCFINPWQAYSLKSDSEWIGNHQSATERGASNPLFTGALGEIDGVIVHPTTQCKQRADGAASINIATSIMCGQEALARGLNEDIGWAEQVDDYEFEHGIGIRAAWQDKILSSRALVQIVTAAITQST